MVVAAFTGKVIAVGCVVGILLQCVISLDRLFWFDGS